MTATSQSLPDYYHYLDNFSVDRVLARLDDHRDGLLNAFEACCGRHVRAGRGDVLALVQEDSQGDMHTLSYAELDEQSAKLAGWFQSQGLSQATALPACCHAHHSYWLLS